MKIIVMENIKKLCAVALFISLSNAYAKGSTSNTAGEFHPVDSNRIPEILTLIPSKVQSNYERIKTWQGKVDSVIDYLYEGASVERVFKEDTNGTGEIPKALRDRRQPTTEFALYVEKDLLYVNTYSKKPIEYTDLERGKSFEAKEGRIPGSGTSVVTPEYYIYSKPHTMRDGVVMSRVALKELHQKNCSTCKTPSAFDPRELFDLPQQPVWKTLPKILKEIRERGEYKTDGYILKVEERTKEGITQYRITVPGKTTLTPDKSRPGDYLFVSSTFSSDKGFNIILKETTTNGDKLFQRHTWDYILIDGIYIPTKTTKQNYSLKTGSLVFEKTSVFKDVKINKPISREVFSYKNLGLKNGDKFVDKIEGKEYTYQDANLVPDTNLGK
jgi:hypothetical protein